MPFGGLKLKLINKHILDAIDGPTILISNHQDNFDAFIIGGFVPKKTVSIGKKVIRLFPFFGQIYWLSGNILIDRKRKKKALGTMNQAAEAMAKKGIRVWIMPEGTRSRGRGLLPFKKGAFHLAKQTNYPVVPVILSNYAQHMNLNSLRKTLVVAKALEPIDPSKFEDVNTLKDHCHQLFEETLKEVDQIALEYKDTHHIGQAKES
jgi:1-acyl-sn-glycerol-3-phosphate acyltransferase